MAKIYGEMFRILRSGQADSRRPGISSNEESAANITEQSAMKIPKKASGNIFMAGGWGLGGLQKSKFLSGNIKVICSINSVAT
jgi:hypothetical protein